MNEAQQPTGVELDESPQVDKLVAALAKAQAAFTHADPSRTAQLTKDGKKRKYATLADVFDAARPHLSANGLAVVQHPSTSRDGIILTTWLMHESGQWMRSRMEFPRPDSDRMSLIQALGTALSYARRYAYAAIVGVAVEDDDGESAERPSYRREDDGEPPTPDVFPRFGPAAGQPIRGADAKHLETYANAMVSALADPERARFKASNEALLDAIRKEQERQRPSSGPAASVYQAALALIQAASHPKRVTDVVNRAVSSGKLSPDEREALEVAALRRAGDLAKPADTPPGGVPDPRDQGSPAVDDDRGEEAPF